MKRKISFGSISGILIIIGILWNTSIRHDCLGDVILSNCGIKAWSNDGNGIHYTIFYSLIFFIAALVLAFQFPMDLLSKFTKIVSIVFIVLILIASLFMSNSIKSNAYQKSIKTTLTRCRYDVYQYVL